MSLEAHLVEAHGRLPSRATKISAPPATGPWGLSFSCRQLLVLLSSLIRALLCIIQERLNAVL